MNTSLRELPSIDEVLQRVKTHHPRDIVVAETRRVLEELREKIKKGAVVDLESIPQRVFTALHNLEQPSLRHVINATGVVLHTNLGRAPLATDSIREGYCNLEFNLETGKRGKRDIHAASLVERLTGKPGLVVNNNAAAVYLVLNSLAAGSEVIVSRGELIEIGDGFRIPDIMARSGAILREVGTTNRTRLDDYRDAINDRTRLIMKVHPSNFRISGFTASPPLDKLSSLAREKNIPLYEDLGSGCLIDLKHFGVEEPVVSDRLKAGASLVSFSGDKLLGGPQAGIIAGEPELLAALRQNPMFRALRVDKLTYQTLEGVLRTILLGRFEEIPVLRMITMPLDRIRVRAERLAAQLSGWAVDVRLGQSIIGGGSTPDQSLPTWLLSLAMPNTVQFEKGLRSGTPPVVARIEDDRLVLDLRTVLESEEEELLAALAQARSR
ncbi:MAG TPA: L-seryl-tRNA(Sec) selenium transferase [Bryobacteraceae bacterium]|nr:L-seryl-tRNA(Sec) selenium transferase [Bryobacteraceae bacterium]